MTYEGEEAILSEWLVEQGSEVKQGDPLATIEVEYDEVALQEMELALERLESDYEWQRGQMEEALAETVRRWLREKQRSVGVSKSAKRTGVIRPFNGTTDRSAKKTCPGVSGAY